MAQILDLTQAPATPIERLIYLSSVMEEAKTELTAEYQRAYFEARSQGLLSAAVDLGIHSRKSILALTRHENNRLGRVIRRWDD